MVSPAILKLSWPYSGFNFLADLRTYAVCYPHVMPDNRGISYWNASFIGCSTDAVGFLSSLAEYLQKKNSLNAKNIFVCAMPNG